MSTTRPEYVVLCPRCGHNHYTPYGTQDLDRGELMRYPFPALSRMDNKTYVCSPCGQDEAMRDAFGPAPLDLADWKYPPKEAA